MTETFSVDRKVPRFNCKVCGSFVTVPDDIPDGYSFDGEPIECPRCRSIYAPMSASASVVVIELAVRQVEYTPSKRGEARTRPRRDAIYADPVFGPIRRAEDRLAAAESDLAQAMAVAHLQANKSIREIADNSRTYRKSRVAEIVKDAAQRLNVKRTPVGTGGPIDIDDFPF